MVAAGWEIGSRGGVGRSSLNNKRNMDFLAGGEAQNLIKEHIQINTEYHQVGEDSHNLMWLCG